MQISRIHANQKKTLVFFIIGAALCVLLEFIGVNSLSVEELVTPLFDIPLPDIIAIFIVYTILGISAGIASRIKYESVFLGLSAGQCQFLLPVIIYFITKQSSDVFMLCVCSLVGIPYVACISFMIFGIKYFFKHKKRK